MHHTIEWLIQEIDCRLPYIADEKLPRWWKDIVFAAWEQAHNRHKAERHGNPVLMQHWLDADTPHADILDWFHRCIELAPYREYLLSFQDHVAVFVLDAPAAEQQNRSSSYTFATREDVVVFHWQGNRHDWRHTGRDALQAGAMTPCLASSTVGWPAVLIEQL